MAVAQFRDGPVSGQDVPTVCFFFSVRSCRGCPVLFESGMGVETEKKKKKLGRSAQLER